LIINFDATNKSGSNTNVLRDEEEVPSKLGGGGGGGAG